MKQRACVASILLGATCLTSPAWAQSVAQAPNSITAPAASSAGAAAPSKEVAQAGRQDATEEIVVTAARGRAEDVQKTPVAVTAVTEQMMEQQHVTDFSQIGDLAPNLQIDKNLGTAGVANIYLRGFGDYSNDPAVDPHVAVFINGIYMPAPVGTLFDAFDLGQVEVQAGPQGTLLGKNAPVGALYITSNKPTGDLDGEVEGDYGSYNHFGARALLDFPILTDETGESILAGRVSIVEKEGGNWVYNIANNKRDMGGENSKSGKFAFSFKPTHDFEWDINGSLAHDNDPQNGSYPANYLGGFPGTPSSALQIAPYPCVFVQATHGFPAGGCERLPYGTTDSTFTSRERDDFALVASSMKLNVGPVTLTSVTGYNSYWQVDNDDDGGTPFVALNAYSDRTRYDQESEDFRISSNKGGGWDLGGLVDWVVGGYYSNENYGFTNNLGIGVLGNFSVPVGVVNTAQAENGTTQSKALYGHFIVNLNDQWTGTFGVRQSWDDKTHAFQGASCGNTAKSGGFCYDIPGAWHNTSFEVGTAYQFDADRMAYVRFAQGYESGGFNGFSVGDEFNPELNNEYEVGFKSDWLNKRLRVNIDFFQNQLTQLQVESALSIPTPPFFLQETLNAGSATVQGWEAQITGRPLEDLTAHLNVGYLDSKFNANYSTTCSNTSAPADCSGLHLAMSPKWTINLGGDYLQELPNDWGSVDFAAGWIYKSSMYTSDPVYPSSFQEGYGLVNLSVTVMDESEKYSVEFYGTNVLDRHYKSGYTDPSGLAGWEKQGIPAEWGMKLVAKFGPFKESPEPAAMPVPIPVSTPAPPAPAPAPEAMRSYQVFFDFNKSDITKAAAKVIQSAADAIKAGNVVQIVVTGHTDTVGSAAYNQHLSEERAAAVKQTLVVDGVAGGEISTTGVGKSGLLVPTADGVREAQNRRAEIVLQ